MTHVSPRCRDGTTGQFVVEDFTTRASEHVNWVRSSFAVDDNADDQFFAGDPFGDVLSNDDVPLRDRWHFGDNDLRIERLRGLPPFN